MRRRVLMLASLLVPLATLPVAAQEMSDLEWIPKDSRWELAGVPTSGTPALHFVATASIARHGEFVRAWSLDGFREIQVVAGNRCDNAKTYWEIDCTQRRWRSLQRVWYLGGEHAYSDAAPKSWSFVIPGTVSETMLDFVCARVGTSGMHLLKRRGGD